MKADRGFWARRKAAVEAEAATERTLAADREAALREAELAERPDAEVLAELDLPDPDTLKAGDDFKAFLVKAVPRHIQRRALRKLWTSNPVLACVDGLNDYDDDYLAGSFNQPPLRTGYQVGRGMLAHLEAVAKPVAEALAETGTEDADADAAETVDTLAEAAADSVIVDAEAAAMPTLQSEADDTPDEMPAPRRMRIRFEEETA
ncbi:DUF3306 domain-containing protein [Sulfitobacter sp. D35]|uniref:DUF3306 domain-containing protein n=1 Tax=Sulfitobacter sp. D35 TaxID=3083252 RepID=UPI00296E7E27|nr:DUF3306 domain-containing protein [Sulfitobacter sp. D35]MDW4497644.1 DUF3306 domain-containing protein [Sulfitobacter sp. D35]